MRVLLVRSDSGYKGFWKSTECKIWAELPEELCHSGVEDLLGLTSTIIHIKMFDKPTKSTTTLVYRDESIDESLTFGNGPKVDSEILIQVMDVLRTLYDFEDEGEGVEFYFRVKGKNM